MLTVLAKQKAQQLQRCHRALPDTPLLKHLWERATEFCSLQCDTRGRRKVGEKHRAYRWCGLSYPCWTHRWWSPPQTETQEKDGTDGHKGRPGRAKRMVTCSAVLVASTWFCPTVSGWELGRDNSSTSTCTEKNGTSSYQMLTQHPSAGDHEKAMMGLLFCCLSNAGTGRKIFY